MYVFQATGESDTVYLASQMALHLKVGMVITLEGQLGAGKTRFIQAIAHSLGVQEVVSSPTFTLIREYFSGSLPMYHMDMYRLLGSEAEFLGLDEYFYGNGVCLVEWSSRIVDLLPEERLCIFIDVLADLSRQIRIIPYGTLYLELCEQLKKNGIWS